MRARSWRALAVVAAICTLLAGCSKRGPSAETLASSKRACEAKYGVGNCIEGSDRWLPRNDALPVSTFDPNDLETPRPTFLQSTEAPVSTPPPAIAQPVQNAPAQQPPSDAADTLVMEDRDSRSGYSNRFTVADSFTVRWSFSNGTVRATNAPSCTFQGKVGPIGAGDPDPGFPPFGDFGRSGRGEEHYMGSGTFLIKIGLSCEQDELGNAQPGWHVWVYD